ncbi:M16 family metallopeptidase [Nannocystaceae bacterium ST9]
MPRRLAIVPLLALLLATPASAGNLETAPAADRLPDDLPGKGEGKRLAAPAKVFPYPWTQKTLANGLKVVVIPTPSPGLVAYRTVVRTGARDEYEKGSTGFAHFFEHMMFRGTKKYPADLYNEIVTRLGADTNAYTSTDVTVYQFDIARDDLATVVELEADRFMNLDYDKEGFETEAGAVYGEYRKNRSSPFFVAYEAVREAAYDVHTYGHTAMGLVEDIKAMPTKYEYSREFFNRYYRPDNCVIIVAGDVEPEATFALIEQHYAAWKPGYKPPKVRAEPKQKAERRIEVPYEGKTKPQLLIGYKAGAFAPGDRQFVASMALAELAFGETSDIHRALVLDEQLVESIDAGASDSRDPGLFMIHAVIKDAAAIEAVGARIDQTVEQFRETMISAERLDAVKSHMKYRFLLGLDTPRSVAESAADIVGVAGDLEAVETLYATLGQITPEDVRDAAREWLRDQQRTLVLVREAKPGEAPGEPIDVGKSKPKPQSKPAVKTKTEGKAG